MEKKNQQEKEIIDEELYTGEGFMNYDELVNIVVKYQQRHKMCEEVDYMEQISGSSNEKFKLNLI